MRRVVLFLVTYVALTTVMVSAALVLLDRVVMPALVHHGDERPVPDVGGLDYAEAARALKAAGFRATIRGHEPSTEAPLGSVVRQEPEPGLRAKPGRTVGLFLGSGPAMSTVPPLTGMGCREALVALSHAGLSVGDILMAPGSLGPVGHVLAVLPPEGFSVERGSPVHLLVAGPAPPECYVVPSFVGRKINEVAQELRARGIHLGRRAFATGSAAPEGTILSTDPPAGFTICRGESLAVVVAS